MRGFAADREPAFEIAIEGNAVPQEVMDAGRSFARDPERDRLIDQARAGRDRIGRVRLRAVAFRDRGGDAALRPRRRGAWPKGAAEITVTGRGASFSAQNNPARPPPTMTIPSVLRVRS